jgi:hypothetical protein
MQLSAKLKPMAVVEIVDAALSAYSDQAWNFFLLSSATNLPLALLLLGYFHVTTFLSRKFALEEYLPILLVASGAVAAGLLLWSVGRGGLSLAVFEALQGNTPAPRACWKEGFRKALPFAFAGLVPLVSVWFGSLFLLGPGLWVGTSFCLARSAVASEQLEFFASLRRSQQLIRGFRFKALCLQLFFGLVWLLAFVNLFLLVQALLQLGHALFDLEVSFLASFLSYRNGAYLLVLNLLLFVLLDPWKVCLDSLFYLDVRTRTEGVDLQLRLEALEAAWEKDTPGRQGLAARIPWRRTVAGG